MSDRPSRPTKTERRKHGHENGANGAQARAAASPSARPPAASSPALRAFKRGDFDVRLPDDLTGVDGQICRDVQRARRDGRRRSATRRTTSRRAVGKEGQAAQAHAPPRRAAAAGPSTSPRSTRCSTTSPVTPNEIARVVTAVARGDLEQTMDVEDGGRRPAARRVPPPRAHRQRHGRAARRSSAPR